MIQVEIKQNNPYSERQTSHVLSLKLLESIKIHKITYLYDRKTEAGLGETEREKGELGPKFLIYLKENAFMEPVTVKYIPIKILTYLQPSKNHN